MEDREQLLEQHQRLLESSAVNAGIAKRRGYFSVANGGALRLLGFSNAQQRVPALLIPLWNVHGDIAFHQARPDYPRVRDGKPVKYETPNGARMALDVHPVTRPHLGDPSRPLIVTEGIRKADAALSQGVDAVALLGVWNWRGANGDGGKAALPDWEAVALDGRTVFLAFDSDVMARPQVRAALQRLGRFLEARGAAVRVCRLQPAGDGGKTGLDDFLAAGGNLDELLATAATLAEQSDDLTAFALTDLGNAHRSSLCTPAASTIPAKRTAGWNGERAAGGATSPGQPSVQPSKWWRRCGRRSRDYRPRSASLTGSRPRSSSGRCTASRAAPSAPCSHSPPPTRRSSSRSTSSTATRSCSVAATAPSTCAAASCASPTRPT